MEISWERIYILIWVTCLLKKNFEVHAQICPKIYVRHSFGPVIILRGYKFFFFEILIFFCRQFHWKRTCGTNMRDNFFATNTLACGTKTWPITISLHQNIHVRRENLAENSGRPWTWPPANRTWPLSNWPRVSVCVCVNHLCRPIATGY